MTNINVIKLQFSNDISNLICQFETYALENYLNYVERYNTILKKFGCEIVVGLEWHNFKYKQCSQNRIKMRNGYECVVYVSILKNGYELVIPSSDGEVDYYRLVQTYTISKIERIMFKKYVYIYLNIDNELDGDMNLFLRKIKTYLT